MASTEAQLCNLALLRIGNKARISALTDNSPEARACSDVYATVRDLLLELYEWPFAKKRLVLTVALTARTGWAYAYQLPLDCLAPRSLNPAIRNPGRDEQTPFELEANDALSDRILLTDEEEPELVYTAKVTAVPAMPPGFQDALAWALAAELALALPVKPDLASAALKMAQLELDRAISAANSQRRSDPLPESEFIRERG